MSFGKGYPFNKMEQHWQIDPLNAQIAEEKVYSRGAANQKSRKTEIGPGGDGKVISRLSESFMAKRA